VALTFKEILELIDRVSERGLSAVEIETSGTKVRIEGKKADAVASHYPIEYIQNPPAPRVLSHAQPPQLSASATPSASSEASTDGDDGDLHIVTSPIVGTFFRAPNPEAENFSNVGDSVTKGKVLCIIEAMKLMNEIESDSDGTIVKIFPQNGQPIEYGEKLFAIRL